MTMKRPAFCAFSLLLASACVSQGQNIEIRKVSGSSTTLRVGDEGIQQAYAMLRLGNAGTALEAFRKVQRERPNADALAGIAACYEAMGRHDLARVNYEAALAMAPANAALLSQIAHVFDKLGMTVEAAQARNEAAANNGALPLPTVDAAANEPSATITVLLPQPRLPEAPRSAHNAGAPGPRLERISSGEIALVTTAKPLWTAVAQAKSQATVTARWIRLSPRSANANLVVLNAARVKGLAGKARAVLEQRGWRQIEIGDHAEVRSASAVYYPRDRQRLGRSLAAQFGIAAKPTDGKVLTLMLGRDLSNRLAG